MSYQIDDLPRWDDSYNVETESSHAGDDDDDDVERWLGISGTNFPRGDLADRTEKEYRPHFDSSSQVFNDAHELNTSRQTNRGEHENYGSVRRSQPPEAYSNRQGRHSSSTYIQPTRRSFHEAGHDHAVPQTRAATSRPYSEHISQSRDILPSPSSSRSNAVLGVSNATNLGNELFACREFMLQESEIVSVLVDCLKSTEEYVNNDGEFDVEVL